jgi:hypothetical protein
MNLRITKAFTLAETLVAIVVGTITVAGDICSLQLL